MKGWDTWSFGFPESIGSQSTGWQWLISCCCCCCKALPWSLSSCHHGGAVSNVVCVNLHLGFCAAAAAAATAAKVTRLLLNAMLSCLALRLLACWLQRFVCTQRGSAWIGSRATIITTKLIHPRKMLFPQCPSIYLFNAHVELNVFYSILNLKIWFPWRKKLFVQLFT